MTSLVTTDAIIIGAGHNGLTCAAYLARAGNKVLIFDAASSVGGMAATRSFAKGYSVPGLAQVAYPLNATICKDLALAQHGYLAGPAIQTIVLDKAGNHLHVGREQVAGEGLSEADIQAYPKFLGQYQAFAKALRPLMQGTPPRLKDMDFADKKALLQLGWNLRVGLGRDSMYEFLRVAAINIYDLLNETFESEQLKSCLAMDAIMGSAMGPRTPGSLLSWLHRLQGSLNGPLALQGADDLGLINALQKSAEADGAVIRCDAKVKRILIENDKAVGVELDNGEVHKANLVISSADPRSTFLSLVGAPKLDAEFANRVTQIRGKGVVAKLTIALNGLPQIRGIKESEIGNRFLLAPSMRYIEKAFNHSKYGEYSAHPVMEFTIPTTQNKGLAPQGHHIISVNVAYAPYQLCGGWQNHKEQFAQNILADLGEFIPQLESMIVGHELLTPVDIEKQYLSTQGHWHHGELSIHQSLMLRPLHGAAQYNAPIDNLFLCGAGCHPGGDLSGLPGHNAAKRILAMGVIK